MNEAGIVEERQKEEDEEAQTSAEEEVVEDQGEAEPARRETLAAELNRKLEEAINREDYEEAARIRDEISRLRESGESGE
jgi:protein-arginine kinase activator protein McsA